MQGGRWNADGIYVQSIHNTLIRNANDRRSRLGELSVEPADLPGDLALPEGVSRQMDAANAGLTAPIGPKSEAGNPTEEQ